MSSGRKSARGTSAGDTAPASALLSSICTTTISPGSWTATIQPHTCTEDSRRGPKRLSRQATQQKPRSLYCEARSFIEYSQEWANREAEQSRPDQDWAKDLSLVHYPVLSPKRDWSRAERNPTQSYARHMHNSSELLAAISSSTIFTEILRRNA
jgi:hypothetical protein